MYSRPRIEAIISKYCIHYRSYRDLQFFLITYERASQINGNGRFNPLRFIMVFFIHIYLSFFQSNLELPEVLVAVLQSCLSVSLNIWRLVIRPSHPSVSHVWKVNRPCFPTSEFLLKNSRYFSCWLDISLIVSCWIEKACMVDLFGLLHIIAPYNSFHDQSWVKACKSN